MGCAPASRVPTLHSGHSCHFPCSKEPAMQAELAALVGSRICHDLISPIGAISNGVELIALTDNSGGAEMALIKQSVESAAARIRFFRIAYGAAAAGQTTQTAEIKSILGALADGGRVSYDWQLPDGQER